MPIDFKQAATAIADDINQEGGNVRTHFSQDRGWGVTPNPTNEAPLETSYEHKGIKIPVLTPFGSRG